LSPATGLPEDDPTAHKTPNGTAAPSLCQSEGAASGGRNDASHPYQWHRQGLRYQAVRTAGARGLANHASRTLLHSLRCCPHGSEGGKGGSASHRAQRLDEAGSGSERCERAEPAGKVPDRPVPRQDLPLRQGRVAGLLQPDGRRPDAESRGRDQP
jgi:hypothetical protein